jgi:general secretion pathway protein D
MPNRKLPSPAAWSFAFAVTAVSAALYPSVSQAAVSSAAWMVIAAAPGQAASPASAREAADKLLRDARGEVKRGDFARAESLILEAEKLGVQYNPLTDRWSDTPDVLRKLLAQERAKSNGAKFGVRAPALLGGGASSPSKPIPSDPTAANQPAGPGPINAAELTGDQKSRALSLLKDARAALARGDKYSALGSWQKAAAVQASYGPNEDSPQRMADELVAAGLDRKLLVPAAAGAGSAAIVSPYSLRPTEFDASQDRLPQLGAAATSPPPGASPANQSPYNLPQETNPLATAPTRGGGQYQPLPQPEPAQPPRSSFQALPEPQRLPTGDAGAQADASRLVAQARLALDRGDLQAASRFSEQAEALNVPDNAFAAGETRPWQMTLEVNRAMVRREGVIQASGAGQAAEPRYPVAQGIYNPATDTTRLVPAATNQQQSVIRPQEEPAPAPPNAFGPVAVPPNAFGPAAVPPNAFGPGGAVPNVLQQTQGQRLFQEGLQALLQQDRTTALQKFNEAWRFQDQLDPDTRQQLKDKLTFLRGSSAPQPLASGEPSSPLEQVNSQQELLRQKLLREILNEEKAAQLQAQKDPKGALSSLQRLRERVATAEVEPASRKQLLTVVDRLISELSTFIDQNKATIEAAEQNDAVKADVVRDQAVRLQSQGKLAEMVEQFNRLMDEKRYPEAEIVAKQAGDVAPNEPVVTVMIEKVKLVRRVQEDLAIKDRTERGVVDSLLSIGESGIPYDDRNPLTWGPINNWRALTNSRKDWLNRQRHMTPAELEIQKSLSKGVEVRFINRPLAEVMDTLGRMAGVNVYLDPQGLNAEGVTTDTPVTLNLTQPISFKSALNLMLSPLGLSYVIQNEVLRITSEQTKDSNVYAKAYYVADLVMPIPNFVPNSNLGLPGAIRESLSAMSGLGLMPRMPTGMLPLTMAKNEGQQPAAQSSAEILAQVNNFGGMGGMPGAGIRNNAGGNGMVGPGFMGPGGMGRGTQPDFDSLTELITSTIAPQSWNEVGGPGAVTGYENNLSLVVSQTQEVHEQIADLLEQLRRLQDLQVTIEVRFITLSDNFFERIGVNFNMNIDDNTNLFNVQPFLPSGEGAANANSPLFDDSNKSLSIGWTGVGPTPDLDVKFTQGSFASAVPNFGEFDSGTVANLGFAILSDLEVFFILEAGQGDSRANILQAPKVTMFNGQFASVTDVTQRPFVTQLIPVVGDFAAAQQPVVVVLNEGTTLSVQAVVSADRRFVRLTLIPFFSQIGDVNEFTFEGSVTTDSGTTVQDPSDPDQDVVNNTKKTVSGTTVQLPVFAVTSVTTTVSVPDGGTILLGGIKRLREQRIERGVPILNKVPYVSRLFKNVGIGREAQSLMMMVTPRIIIQEEEEQKLGIELPQP